MSRRKRYIEFLASEFGEIEMPAGFTPIIRLWILRILIRLNRIDILLKESFMQQHESFSFLGIEVDPDLTPDNKATLRDRITFALQDAESDTSIDFPGDSSLVENVRWCQRELGLSDDDVNILMFLTLELQVPILNSVVSTLGHMSSDRLFNSIAKILNIPASRIRVAFDQDKPLVASGLLSIDERAPFGLREKIDILSGLCDRLTVKQNSILGLFQNNFVVASEPHLTINCFDYLQPRIDHLSSYLKHAVLSRSVGVNVLLYGPPGTGKSQCALMLARSAGAECFEVSVKNGRERLSGIQRMNSYVLSQRILKHRTNAFVIFDEMEDIDVADDDDDFSGGRLRRTGRKGFFNQILENNPIPSIWVSNRIHHIDPAHLRRFSYCMEMPIPPHRVRTRILNEHVNELGFALDAGGCHTIAANEHLSPGMVSNAVKVVRAMFDAGVREPANGLLHEVLNGALTAQRRPNISNSDDSKNFVFRLDAINTDVCLRSLIEGLNRHPSARILMSGPPGTGKTYFAEHIAASLDIAVIARRASDLISPYVGETEQNINVLFRTASKQKSLLLIDEVDTFLNARNSSSHRYEVSMVNEMLTQLEAFNGLCVFTTNQRDQIDEAALRRFDLKISFDYCNDKQISVMLDEACRVLGLDFKKLECFRSMIPSVTPGDFSTILRQSRFRPVLSEDDLLQRLINECNHKQINRKQSIGFIQAA